MPATTKPVPAPFFRAKVTSKGQITVPVEIRKSLGIKPGDHLRFEQQESDVRLLRDTEDSVFEQFRGIGIPGIGPGREGVLAYMREIRGYDEHDEHLA
ncbi:MAG: AbrB/MazE/SpoVT family DNA-binding domain-containing protein [Terracidiphilus sp.]|jgi:AbrB family looped-hinge helix DNA binding protein